MKYSGSIGDSIGRRFQTPNEALRFQLKKMMDEVAINGVSRSNHIPINRRLLASYLKAGIPVTRSEVIDYDPIDEIALALRGLIGKSPKKYSRTFSPGQGEGTHTDPHNLVVTYTHDASALFTIEGAAARIVTPYHIVAFDATIPHEVSAPLRGNLRRTISAFGIEI
jgi:hypothetical protein